MPQRVQNLVIRDYCKSNGLHFILSVAEYRFAEKALQLRSIVEGEDSDIVFYSLRQMPLDRVQRNSVYGIISNGRRICFALEDIVIESLEDARLVELMIMLLDHECDEPRA